MYIIKKLYSKIRVNKAYNVSLLVIFFYNNSKFYIFLTFPKVLQEIVSNKTI